MATTTWTATSGAWGDAANWSAGVPGPGDDAVFPDSTGSGTITGDGAARSVTLAAGAAAQFTGHHDLGTLADDGYLLLAATAGLTFASATLSSPAGAFVGVLAVQSGATVGAGTIVLDGGTLEGTLGAIANPVVLASTGTISAVATLFGRVSGPGALVAGEAPFYPGGGLVLANPGDDYAGGTVVEGGQLVLAATGAEGTGPLLVAGDLFLDPGVATGPIVAISGPPDASGRALPDARVGAADASPTVFASHGTLLYLNGSGAATVIGSMGAEVVPGREAEPDFGTLSVSGGAGSVTVFGGDSRGTVFGGLAGHNVIVAGAEAAGYTPGAYPGDRWTSPQGAMVLAPGTVTIGGGGDGDLLVVTGRQDNLVAAAGGNETLTGSGASGDNLFFGGTGADLIVAGAGRDLVVANGGAVTVSGGAGEVSVLAGGGQDVVVCGAGGAYVQAGAGTASVFTGSGADLIAFVAGQSGGSVTVVGFRPGTDHLAARGYGAAPVVSAVGGSTVLAFADGGRAILAGVARLPSGSLV